MVRGVFLTVVLLAGAAIQFALPSVTSAQAPDLLNFEKSVKQTAEEVLPATTQLVTETVQQSLAPPARDADEEESGTASAKEVTEAVSPVTKTVAEKAEPVFKDIAKTAEPVVETVTKAVEPVVKPVPDTTEPVLDPVTETAAPLAKTVTEAAGPAIEPISETVETVTEPVGKVIEPATTAVLETVGPISQPVIDTLEPVTKPVIDAVTPVLAPVIENVTPVVQPVIHIVEPVIIEVITPLFDLVEPLIVPVVEVITPLIDPMIDILQPIIDPVIDIVDPVIEPVIDVIPPALPPLFPSIEIPDEIPGDLPMPSIPSVVARAPEAPGSLIAMATELVGGTEKTGLVPSRRLRPESSRVIAPTAAPAEGASGGSYLTNQNSFPRGPGRGSTVVADGAPTAGTSLTSAIREQIASLAGEVQRSGERSDWPPSGMLALYLALAATGYMLLLSVTEASPRSWRPKLVTPPS